MDVLVALTPKFSDFSSYCVLLVDQVACTTTCEQGCGMYEEQKHPGTSTVAAFQSCAPTSERFSV